jgi:hypothetical protein
MTLANPLALFWGLLAVPIVMLYARRVRLRRQPVATGMIWQQVFADEQARGAWRRWRHAVALAVQLLVLTLLVLAMADPQVSASGQPAPPLWLYLVGAAGLLLTVEWCLYQRRWMS